MFERLMKTAKRRRKDVSSIRLKVVILKSNKDKVIYFALKYIEEEKNYEVIKGLISNSKNYICPINDKAYLSKIYDEIYSLAKEEYKNELVESYEIGQGFGYPFGFDEFIDITLTDENLESTSNFIYIDDHINKKENLLPIEFLINCKLEKLFLKESEIKIVALALLQIVYIKELNTDQQPNKVITNNEVNI